MGDRTDFSNPIRGSEYPGSFYALQKQNFELYHLGKYRAALTLAEKTADSFPEKDDRTTYWKACLCSRLGRLDEALQLLNDATGRGLWWSEESLKLEMDLDPIRDKAEFKIFLAECNRLNRAAVATTKSELIVLTPTSFSSRGDWPLIIALHPRGEDFEDFVRLWRHSLSKGVVLAFPRSSQVFSSHSRCWDDLARSEREVADAYSQLKNSYKLDPKKIIMAGFSQGATLAIYLALRRDPPTIGFIAVAPASTVVPSHSEEFISFVKANKSPSLKGWFLVGDKDRFFEPINILHSIMEQNGLRSQYVVEPGLGHDYPHDFEVKLGRAVDFVLD